MTADTAELPGQLAPDEVPPPLRDLLWVRFGWQGKFIGRTFPSFTEHALHPEPGWPVGRKGLTLERLWTQLHTPASEGIMICDGDVTIDPEDMGAMMWAVGGEREAVHTAPVKLWPKATGFPDWIWGHRKLLPPDLPNDQAIAAWQQDIPDPVMFTFNFTFLPRRLIEGAIKTRIGGGLAEWIYPHVDENMFKTAMELGIPVRVVRNGCHPRHVNY